MVDRNVRVRLSLDPHNFISGLGKSAFAARAFVKSLGDSDGRLRAFTNSMDASRESTSMLIRAVIALGPALIPTLAAATPAVFGLTAGLAAMATGGAVTALALNGVGTALTALNDYQLEPTTANLEKLQQAMAQLSPAAQEFTLFLQKARPELQNLQDIAAEGALPGFQEGIEGIMDGLPVFERLVSRTAEAVGRLASDAGQAFTDDPFWVEFTEFIAREAGPTLETYGRIFANFGKMVGGVIMAFDPLADDFNDGLLTMSERLADWGTNLSGSRGFQDFMDYVRESGPQVMDALGSIANALIQLVEAAAPLGGPTLQIISSIADIIAAVADSPAGTVLIGVAAGLSAIASIRTLGQIASFQALGALLKGGAKDGAAAGVGFRSAAAGVGVLALSLTDLDDKMGVANTATGALIGLMATGGPWGAAIGGAIGLTQDLAKTNDDLRGSFDHLTDTLTAGESAFSLQGAAGGLADFRTQLADMEKELTTFGLHSFKPGNIAETWEGILGTNDLEEFEQRSRDARDELALMTTALNEIRHGLSGSDEPLAGYTNDLDLLQQTAERVIPALEDLGYSQEQIKDALTFGGDIGTDQVIADLKAYFALQDSIPGRSHAVADAISDIGNEALSAADSAGELSAALDALFTPELDLSAATDEWIAGLKGLKEELDATSAGLKGNSAAALQNREAIRGLVTNLIDLLNAQAAAGKGPNALRNTLAGGRQQILKFAEAAGLGRKETAAFLRELGLTPKLVKIVMETNFSKREQDIARVREAINKLPKEVITRMTTPGAIQSRADVVALAREIELTPKQKKILMGLIDNASGGIKGIISLLNSVHDKTVTLRYNEYRTTFYQSVFEKGIGPGQSLYNADGNLYRGGRPMHFADGTEHHRAMIGRPGDIRVWNEEEAGGEAYIPLAPSKRRRSLDIWAMTGRLLGVPGFADGKEPKVGSILRGFNIGPKQDVAQIRAEFHELLRALREEFGKDAPIIKHMDRMGHRMLEAAKRQDQAARKHEKAVDKLERIEDRRDAFMQSVRQAFTSDAFGGEDIFGRKSSKTQLEADANMAEAAIRQFRRLGRKGLDDAIIRNLAQSGNTALIRDLSGSSRKEIAAYERTFRRRQRALKELGLLTGRQVFGDERSGQRDVVRRTGKTLRRLDRTLNRFERKMEHRIERGAREGVREGMQGRNKQQQRRRRAGAVR